MQLDQEEISGNVVCKLKKIIFGGPKQIKDPQIFHTMALVPVLAWVGLGADGLSSSAYGPEEAFRALGGHTYLSIFLGLATAATVFIISASYSRIIEHFPNGGGGYVVSTHLLSEKAGVVSGCALLVDYILTITISVASCTDAVFSFLPISLHHLKLFITVFLILLLVALNIRGVKESITVMAPIFVVFVVTHILLLVDGMIAHSDRIVPLAHEIQSGLRQDISSIGIFGVLMLFLRAYSLGGGTYTGIEAVSNGMQIMREPRIKTGKRTMLYMSTSLAFTAGVLFFCYSLAGVTPVEGKTLNAVLADSLFEHWPLGQAIALITIFSEGALLLVAAQTGFVDGPRVMANMAVDSWLPHRFAALSERLSMQNGIVIMGASAIGLLLYTNGSVSALVIMYSINVFITFSLSQLGMSRFYLRRRHDDPVWKQRLAVHLLGFILCITILLVTAYEKFSEGGWVTFLITSLVISVCYMIRSHYIKVRKGIMILDEDMLASPTEGPTNMNVPKREDQTAIQLVSSYSGFGIYALMSILKNFPDTYKNIIFVSVAVIDSGSFKGKSELEELERSTMNDLRKYVLLARRLGFAASFRTTVATDVVQGAIDLCTEISKEYRHSTVFTGQLVFELEKLYHRMLHNETAFAIQRRLQWKGITTVILPVKFTQST